MFFDGFIVFAPSPSWTRLQEMSSTSSAVGDPGYIFLMAVYADLPMDLADASLVVLAEHLGHGRILSTDQRDFHAYRWKQRRPFENLLLDA